LSSNSKKPEKYIQELEEKIVDLSLKLRQKNNELKATELTNQKVLGKLIHNLKNPIGVISSFSEMMLEDLEDFTPEKITKFLNAINNSAKFSLNFLTSIAKYTQVSSSEFNVNKQKVNLIDLIASVIDKLGNEAKNKNINILKKYKASELFLNVDSTEIIVALYNILHNAIRFSFKNSTISIFINNDHRIVELIFLDEGIGISEDNLQQIFEPFYVINTYDDEKNKCIGLGLKISKTIIEKHEGSIVVKSTLNKGSSFNIVLKK
jgi:K+-sensing histidine kinase KdpD